MAEPYKFPEAVGAMIQHFKESWTGGWNEKSQQCITADKAIEMIHSMDRHSVFRVGTVSDAGFLSADKYSYIDLKDGVLSPRGHSAVQPFADGNYVMAELTDDTTDETTYLFMGDGNAYLFISVG